MEVKTISLCRLSIFFESFNPMGIIDITRPVQIAIRAVASLFVNSNYELRPCTENRMLNLIM